ncbi:MAG TPA: C13 family peptidase [Dokdonella sp.]
MPTSPLIQHLVDGARVTLLRAPRGGGIRSGIGVFVALVLVYLLVTLVLELASSPPPLRFSSAGVLSVLTDAMLTLVAAWSMAVLAARRGIAPGIAALLLAATIAVAVLVHWPLGYLMRALIERDHPFAAGLVELASRGWWFLVLLVVAHWLSPRGLGRTLLSAVLAYAVSAAAWWWLPTPSLLVTFMPEAEQAVGEALPDDMQPAPDAPAFDAEAVLYRQPALLDAAIARLAPQRPGVVDLYVVTFGGDAQEDVFRNEAAYAARLFEQRFGAEGRTVVLANHADTVDGTPLATWTGLHHALEGIARTMDPGEDLLLVYLTTHGGEGHQLLVDLDPLPLNQITPADLADAFRTDPAIRWKVVVVNACFLGGFIDALRDDSTMVMTSARSDRTSFGCGVESEITWFGKAFLAEALNETTSLREAFDLAQAKVRRWEADEQAEHSEPQLATSTSIENRLERWRSQLSPRPPFPFVPPDSQ